MAWAMVIAAGLLEMVWSYSAKRSDGFARLGWAGLTVIASLASFCLLVFSMRRLPLGTAYAVWTGIGATGSFLVGIAALGLGLAHRAWVLMAAECAVAPSI